MASDSMNSRPRKLLLATDLSARCDRALERAVSLATDWQAQLTVLHVFEDAPDPMASRTERSVPSWRRPPDALAIAKQRIRDGLRADLGDAVDQAVVQPLHLLHAFDLPYANLIPDPASVDKSWGAAIAGELDVFLTSLDLSAEARRRLNPLTERGRPDTLIRAYVKDHDADLVVLGTHGRNVVLEALIGSTAKNILSALPCDALVVRAAS